MRAPGCPPPYSPIVKALQSKCGSDADAVAQNEVELLFDTAMLTSGFIIEEPNDFASRIFSMVRAKTNALWSNNTSTYSDRYVHNCDTVPFDVSVLRTFAFVIF